MLNLIRFEFFKVYQNFVTNVTLFFTPLPSLVLLYSRHKMDDSDGIYNCDNLKYFIAIYF